MTILKRVFLVGGAAALFAALVAGSVLAWFWWNRIQNKVSHRYLTKLEVGLLNDTCEMCHRPESEFYRGNVKISLARRVWKGPVTCTDCHDFVRNEAVSQKCVECHTASYLVFVTEWTTGFVEEMAFIAKKLERTESVLAAAPRGGLLVTRAARLVREARAELGLVQRAQGVHHPETAYALLAVARQKAEKALDIVARQ